MSADFFPLLGICDCLVTSLIPDIPPYFVQVKLFMRKYRNLELCSVVVVVVEINDEGGELLVGELSKNVGE